MQVVREKTGSNIRFLQRRKGEQRVGNLPRSLEQLAERRANAGCDRLVASPSAQSWGPKGLALCDKPAPYQLVGEVTAHQG